MTNLQWLFSVCRSVRHASSVAVREAQPTKFVVKDGKFVRVSEKSPSVTEEVTHTGQVSSLRLLSQ